MAIQSQYVRGAGEQPMEAGESGALIAGPKFTAPKLDVAASSHTANDAGAPTLEISVGLL